MWEAVSKLLSMGAAVFVADMVRYAVGCGSAFAVLHLFRRRLQHRHLQQRPRHPGQMGYELRHSLIAACGFALVGALAKTGVQQGWMKLYFDLDSHGWLYTMLSLPLLAILHDSYFYWTHRLMHSRALFRHLHVVHHRSRRPTPFAAYSFNIGEALITALFFLLVPMLIPLHGLVMLIYLYLLMFRNAFGHSNVELFPAGFIDGPLGWNITNTHHDLHHRDLRHNFALYFTWWDRWMGTEHPAYRETFAAATCGPQSASALQQSEVAHRAAVGTGGEQGVGAQRG